MRKRLYALALALMLCGTHAWAEGVILSDSEIVEILTTLNIGEIHAANLGLQKSGDSELKELAQQLLTDHQALQAETVALARELRFRSENSTINRMLVELNDSSLKRLKLSQGANFDSDYLEEQLRLHRLAQEVIENLLIPSAGNTELKALLDKTSAKAAAHLRLARQVEMRAKQKLSP